MQDAVTVVRTARDDPSLVVLEGFHAVKHALRFGAAIERIFTPTPERLRELSQELAPDLLGALLDRLEQVDGGVWRQLGGRGLPTPAVAVAPRPTFPVTAGGGPSVLLEDPRHLGNLGACVRVAAAAGATALYTTGRADPWHPSAVRASAGLHFAVPVTRIADYDGLGDTLVALDPAGPPLGRFDPPTDAMYVFGTERHGLSADLRSRATLTVSIPMRPGVSSLNLATAVAVVLYHHGGMGG